MNLVADNYSSIIFLIMNGVVIFMIIGGFMGLIAGLYFFLFRKKKKFTHAMKIPLFNFIMNKCNIKAIQYEDELGLPIHVQMPKLKAKSNNPANYTG